MAVQSRNLVSPCRSPSARRWAVPRLLGCLSLSVWLLVHCAAAAALPSVASTDLCGDLLLLQIADPQQIRSLSSDAANPELSPLAARAQGYPANRGSVEELLLLKPEIALVYQGWTGRGHAELLAGRGVQITPLPYPVDWDTALQTARTTAALIGRAAQGDALVTAAERRMQSLAERISPYRVLYLRPNGGSAGAGTYVDDLLQRLGLRNLATEQGLRGWGRFPLEQLMADPPDLFLLGYFDQTQPVSKSGYARHPWLRDMLARTPSIAVPAGGWGCGGLELVEIAEQIVARISALSLAGRD